MQLIVGLVLFVFLCALASYNFVVIIFAHKHIQNSDISKRWRDFYNNYLGALIYFYPLLVFYLCGSFFLFYSRVITLIFSIIVFTGCSIGFYKSFAAKRW